MSVQNVTTFLDRTATDQDLLAKVWATHNTDTNATAANVVALAASIGLTFTADEYRSEVESEVANIFQLQRAVPHHILLTVAIP
jgi:hypothetical protein